MYVINLGVEKGGERGLETFGDKNQTTVNGVKTKIAVFGKHIDVDVTFKGKPIEQVTQYKYLGNITTSIQRPGGDIYVDNYQYLCDKARKAIHCLLKRVRGAGCLPPNCMFYMFQSCIQPILTYGSEVWGSRKAGREAIDKIFLWYHRLILRVKATTSNVITVGECGQIPPSVQCISNCILYFLRIKSLHGSSLVNIMFREQERLHSLGFPTWYGRVWELAQLYQIDLNAKYRGHEIKRLVNNFFKAGWVSDLNDLAQNPILRTYIQFKQEFRSEPFLSKVKNLKYRAAISKFRASSHTLEIERGRYTRPVTPVQERICAHCKVIEDEKHFLLDCSLYQTERAALMTNILSLYPSLVDFNRDEVFCFILGSDDAQVLTWLGKYLYSSFAKKQVGTLK